LKRCWLASTLPLALAAGVSLAAAPVAWGQKRDPDGLSPAAARAALAGGFGVSDVPDIFGPGHVLSAGNLYAKVTNFGHVGNYFLATSSDPAGQWPGGSGIEYLSTIRLAVAASDPTAPEPSLAHRVSYFLEWRPPTLGPVDHIYESYEGAPRGARYVNEDGDREWQGSRLVERVDEEFLNGKDDDGDGQVDEDYAAVGQQMFALEMRDDTPEAVNATYAEKHVPLGLECRQRAWAYATPGNADFDVFEYAIRNVSGHRLDSLYVAFLVDLDAGPGAEGSFFQDDFAVPSLPSGARVFRVEDTDPKYQGPLQGRTSAALPFIPPCPPDPSNFYVSPDSGLCPWDTVIVNGFSLVDGDGDGGRTPGAAMFLLLGHDVDARGLHAPKRVGFRAFRMFYIGQAYGNGGAPAVDAQRYELISSTQGVDPVTGFIDVSPPAGTADYAFWCSVGPFLEVGPGQTVTVTTALAVAPASRDGLSDPDGWHAPVELATLAQRAYNGVFESRLVAGRPNTSFYGRETALKAPPGQVYRLIDCVDNSVSKSDQLVTDSTYTFFNFDDDYCTGPWSPTQNGGRGYFRNRWKLSAPPPSPDLNVSAGYNYTANPDRRFVPARDTLVVLAWDNLSEHTPDPGTGQFDFRGYKIWKAAGWKRPRGSAGPAEADWALQADFRLFDARASHCARVYVPARRDTMTLCMRRGDLVDWEHGIVLEPDTTVRCEGWPVCDTTAGLTLTYPSKPTSVKHYPVGRWRWEDRRVLDGFTYFYSVTAYDSTYQDIGFSQLETRPYAVEADAVVPQTVTRTGRRVWVVPNPYRAHAGWDLTPSAADPTGAHIDFYGMPPGPWRLRIYTVAGDLVEELHAGDAVNASLRPGGPNLQQDTAADGQARWNLITRNGQEVASGIYLFTVESREGTQVGKFVVIR
jgi:hypothetical protein